MAMDAGRRDLKFIADQISTCRQCPDMNEPGVTALAPEDGGPRVLIA